MSLPSQRSNVVKVRAEAVEVLTRRFSPGPKIAYGFTPDPGMNLQPGRGRTLADLQFKNLYLGSWTDSDMQSIDRALAGAMADPNLNHVIEEYFTQPITSTFLGGAQRRDSSLAPGSTFDRDAVHQVLASLDLGGIDTARTVFCLYLPPGVILDTRSKAGVGDQRRVEDIYDLDVTASSLEGLGGYHGSAEIGGAQVLFAVSVYSQVIDHKPNGIPFWPDQWKNIVATMYHELNEIRTDPDVEEAMRKQDDSYLGWYSQRGGEIGDIPLYEAGPNLGLVMVEVPLVAGGTAPIQLMWSNKVSGPCRPF